MMCRMSHRALCCAWRRQPCLSGMCCHSLGRLEDTILWHQLAVLLLSLWCWFLYWILAFWAKSSRVEGRKAMKMEVTLAHMWLSSRLEGSPLRMSCSCVNYFCTLKGCCCSETVNMGSTISPWWRTLLVQVGFALALVFEGQLLAEPVIACLAQNSTGNDWMEQWPFIRRGNEAAFPCCSFSS